MRCWMKWCIAILSLSCLLWLPGCVPVPEEVRKETGLYEQMDKQEVDTDSLTFSTLEELREETERLKGQTYNQITLPEQIRLPEQDMYLLGMGNFINNYERADELRDIFLPDFMKTAPQYKETEERIHEIWYDGLCSLDIKEFSIWDCRPCNKEKDMYTRALSTDNKGYLAYSKDWNYDNYGVLKRIQVLHIGEDEIPDESYSLSGEQESIKDAIDFVEKTVNEQMTQLNGDIYRYSVEWFYVLSDGQDNYYSMVLGRSYKGASFDASYDYEVETEELYNEQSYTCAGYPLLVEMYKPDEIGFFREDFSVIPVEREPVDSYLSLQSAMDIVSDKLSSKSLFDFDEVSLCYTLRQENPTDIETGKKKYPYMVTIPYLIDETCEGRPTWVFFVERDRYNGLNIWERKNGHSLAVLVDAVDGTFQYYTGDWGN